MPKQKAPGGFRTATGIGGFATIGSYLSTMRERGADILQALVLGFQGI